MNTQRCSMTDSTRTVANNVRLRCRKAIDQHSVPGLRTRNSVQQRSTATTALSNTFDFIQLRPGEPRPAAHASTVERFQSFVAS